MTIPIHEFWRLVIESQLLPPLECQRLGEQFGHVKGAAAQGNARTLAEWLIAQNVISRYQATILLGGRAGPFNYGDYKVYDRLESGPLAGQFKAVHAFAVYPVTLQFFGPDVTGDPQRWMQAADRARRLEKLRHPHLWRAFELVDLGQFKFLAVDDVPGQSMRERLSGGARMESNEACRIAYQTALGLASAHESGFIHGDVRPANIQLDRHGRAVLWCDAGRGAPSAQLYPNDPQAIARADYFAPELAQPGRTPDALSDIYALGCTLYEMLTGRAPFMGGDIAQKLQRHAAQPIDPLAPYGVPEPLAKVVAFLMAKNPAVRFQQATQVADQLGQFLPSQQRQPQVAPAAATLAAYEQFLRNKPKAAPTPFSPSSGAVRPSTPIPVGAGTFGAGAFGGAFGAAASSSPVASPFAASAGEVAPAFGNGSLGNPTTGATAQVGTGNFASNSAPVWSGPTSGGAMAGAGGAAGGAAVLSSSAFGAAASGPKISTSPSGRLKEKKPLSKNKPLLIAIGTIAALLLAVGGLALSGAFGSGDGGETVATNPGDKVSGTGITNTGVNSNDGGDGEDEDEGSTSGDGGISTGTTTAGPRFQVSPEDDGQTLWAPPTSASPAPIDLTFVPSEAQVYIIARPSEIMANPHGQQALTALGPDFAALLARWEKTTHVTLDEIDQLVIGIHDNNSQMPRFSTTVRLKNPVDFKARWNNPPAAGGEGRYQLGGKTAWIPPAGDGKVFVLSAPQEIDPLVESGAPKPKPQLDPHFTTLAEVSDAGQHVTVLFNPHFFHTDGRDMFRGQYAKLIEPLDWFFGDDVHGALALNLGETFYGELRLYARLQKTPTELTQEFRGKLDQLPQKLEKYIASLNPPEYWRQLWFKYPQMISAARQQIRIGSEDEMAVINFVLPGSAAPNLIAASELTIASTPGASSSTGTTPTTPAKAAPKSIEELLTAKIDLGFDQQSLEFAMRDLAAAARDEYPGLPFDFQIKILGPDLQKDGITRNQSIRDLRLSATPVGEALTQLVRKANPVTTVKDPSETDQKLVWVIGPDPDDAAKKIILVTTRTAAAEKKYTLPAVFVPKKE